MGKLLETMLDSYLQDTDALSEVDVEYLERLMVALYADKRTDIYAIRSKWDPEGYRISQGKQKISDHTRWTCWRRDNFTCVYCGMWGDKLTLDHVIPEEQGGDLSVENLVTACGKCNNRKAAMSREDFEKTEWLKKKKEKVRQHSSTTIT